MDNYLLDSDDSEIETETKTYTPKEFNDILQNFKVERSFLLKTKYVSDVYFSIIKH